MTDLKIKSEIKRNESLKRHTHLSVGGEADYFIPVNEKKELQEIINFCGKNDIPFYVIGSGANILFTDEGFRGVVISTVRMRKIKIDNENIYADAGVLLRRVIRESCIESLSGLEFLVGIPGTMGGAVMMNAGAYGTEIGNYVKSVNTIKDSTINKIKDLKFSYRNSNLKGYIITDVHLKLKKGKKKLIKKRMRKTREKRKERLPIIPRGIGTCGSVFKNPENDYAARLIDEAGLKGRRIGGAWVSMDHSNFILTNEKATAQDVIDLIRLIRSEVDKKFKVKLQKEVIIVGQEEEIQI